MQPENASDISLAFSGWQAFICLGEMLLVHIGHLQSRCGRDCRKCLQPCGQGDVPQEEGDEGGAGGMTFPICAYESNGGPIGWQCDTFFEYRLQ